MKNQSQKITLTNPQHKVSQSKKRFRVLVTGRRFGKTYLCITEMMKYATQVKKNIWYVAPTFKMAIEIVWSKREPPVYSAPSLVKVTPVPCEKVKGNVSVIPKFSGAVPAPTEVVDESTTSSKN